MPGYITWSSMHKMAYKSSLGFFKLVPEVKFFEHRPRFSMRRRMHVTTLLVQADFSRSLS